VLLYLQLALHAVCARFICRVGGSLVYAARDSFICRVCQVLSRRNRDSFAEFVTYSYAQFVSGLCVGLGVQFVLDSHVWRNNSHKMDSQ